MFFPNGSGVSLDKIDPQDFEDVLINQTATRGSIS